MCKIAFRSKIFNFNDHNKSIVDRECIDVYVDATEWCLPRLWKHMCHLRNVNGNRSKVQQKRVKAKKRQVLLQILVLRRMQNPKSLLYWSLIQSIAYYGWGVGCTALDCNNYWGNSCSARTQDRCLLHITSKLAEHQIRLYSNLDAVTFCIDNVQCGQHVKHQ